LGSIQEYIFNDIKDLFTGKLNSSKENSNYFDIIDSPSSKEKDCNIIMIPKLIINKNNKKNSFNELFEVAYNKLKKYENKKYEFYHQIFYFYRKNKSNNLAAKIYTIFPNVNLEFRQIKNLSFSNTNLNKYLISSKYQLQEMSNDKLNNSNNIDDNYLSGFFTMSQNHRLIALKDDIKETGGVSKSQSLKEIIFGIWINLKEEKPNSNNKSDLDFLFNKNKLLIYKQCFRFIELSSNIETIYSPSPEENVFILVLFYKGIQCHYEVKLNFNLNSNLNKNNNKNDITNINTNSWLISKCKYELDEQAMKVPFDYDIKIEINNGNISSMDDFLNKKIGNKQQINNNEIKKENLTNSKNNENKKENNEINVEKNNISDVFNLSDFNGDSMNGEYKNKFNIQNNINNNNNNLININNQNNKNEHDQNYLNKKQSQISHISHASTNAHSKKPSLSLSKNSKNNKEGNNMEQIYASFNKEEKEYKEEINISDNFSESISQYSSIIKKNSENIKKLENQVNKMELEIKEIIKNLEEENNFANKKDKKNKKIEKNVNNNDVSGIGDISINVPKIICKDLSMTNDL